MEFKISFKVNLKDNDNLLQQILHDDTLTDEALNIIKMKINIQKAKEMHPYPIHYSEKSGYFTSVDDNTQPTGKRKIRRKTEESLWEKLAEWYIDKYSLNITFKELVETCLEKRNVQNHESTYKRLMASWNSYYLNEPLSASLLQKPVAKITSLDLREWAELLLKKHFPVDKKKFSRIFSIVNQTLEYASDEDIALIPSNTWQKARKKLNKDLIVEKQTPLDEEQVFTDEERKKIKQMVHDDLKRYKQSSASGLQVLFLFETGVRIGECCGLKWTDVKDGRLYISRQADNNGVREWTKTVSGKRDIPLTTEAQNILDEVKKFNDMHGYNHEWIFQSDNEKYDYRLSYNSADRKLRKLCKRLGTIIKSPHKCRKTCISTLLDCPTLNDRTVQRFAGHRDISTTIQFYSFERKDKEQQALIIDQALSL